MCTEEQGRNYMKKGTIWQLRGGGYAVTLKTTPDHDDKPVQARVIVSGSKKTKVGDKLTWKTKMGHVLCKGDEDRKGGTCKLHDNDAVTPVMTDREDIAELLIKF